MRPARRARALRFRSPVGLILGAGLLLVFAASCASKPPPPDWLAGSSTRFPEDRFVVGVAANANAEASVKLAFASVSEQTKGESERTGGTRVEETWFDAESNTHWALAVLDRQPVLDQAAQELSAIDTQIAGALANVNAEAPEDALRALAAATSRIPDRDMLRARIVNLGGTPTRDDASAVAQAQQIARAFADVKRQLRIEVSSFEMNAKTGETGDPLAENRRALAQRVLALGFTPDTADVAWGSDPIWLRVESKVAIERLFLHPNDKLVAVHWDAALEITNVAGGGDVVAVLTQEGRAVHLSEQEARRRADADARDFAAAALEQWLSENGALPPAAGP